MPSPDTLDFESLLSPIEGDTATGPDLRKDFSPDAIYRSIKAARYAARRVETRAVWDDDDAGEKPDWRPVLDESPRVLATTSKDLEIAAWLTEALVRQHGFAGLRDGFRLCYELVDRYWDQLHPIPDADDAVDEDEPPFRVSALVGLNGSDADGTLIAPILSVSIVEGGEFGPLGVSVYDQATNIEQIGDAAEQAKRLEHGAVSIVDFKKAISDSSATFYQTMLEDLTSAQTYFDQLCTVLDSRCGDRLAPPSSNIRDALDQCKRVITSVSADILAAAGIGVTVEEGDGDTGDEGDSGGRPGRSGPIRTREEAFATLHTIAQFFRETEPHSVLPFQLEECVKWGRMDLPQLLKELISDSSTRDDFFRRVGIVPPDDGDS